MINLLCNYLRLFISLKENYFRLFSKVRFSLLYSLFSPVHSNFSGIYCFFIPSISLFNPNFLSLLNFLHPLSAATSATCFKQEYSKNRRNKISAKRLWSPNTFCFHPSIVFFIAKVRIYIYIYVNRVFDYMMKNHVKYLH